MVKPDIVLHVQDVSTINFEMAVGTFSESVTVTGGAPLIDTESAAVSTVVDRQFAENLPLNGRSFQTLIQLTPGVVLTANSGLDSGQFSVNGQRASSNYWMVDGASANIGISAFTGPVGNGLGGTLGSYSALGGTNSMVSVDALQEFRIQTSTYAPEFGRTPGGQISIVTRSGTNEFHGTLFDYLRNDVLDANDWFADSAGLPKPKERQNDFGGTLSGPILKDRTFFFFSYEGLRLRLPQTQLTTVPDTSFTPGGTTNSRQNAVAAIQPYLNAFPQPNPNSPEIFAPCDPATDPTCPPTGQKATGSAAFNGSFSNPATLDAYSLRIDHKLNGKLLVFGRYNYSPSEIDQRGLSNALSDVSPARITTQTGTVGVTWSISTVAANDFRFNYSRVDASSSFRLDTFGGAVPLATVPFPSPFTVQNGEFVFGAFSLGANGGFTVGKNSGNQLQQFNVVDSMSIQKGAHSLKFGVDFRRLSPRTGAASYGQQALFNGVPDAETGNLAEALVAASRTSTLLFRNLGVFAQDTWRIAPRLTLTYGLRWDVDVAPSSTSGPGLPAVTGFNLTNLSNLALAPTATPPFKTTYGNVAPRIGLAYQISQNQDWLSVIRGGFGVFYDLASAEVGNNIAPLSYPFGAQAPVFGSFPLSPAAAVPPLITPADLATGTEQLDAFDPHLRLPYTLQWNIGLEQELGRQQTITTSYIGSVGRRLIQTAFTASPNPNVAVAQLVTNAASANYNALQVQYQRRLTHGLQALASYTWSHSIDTASAGSFGLTTSNALVALLNPNVNRGPSDFDIRSGFSAGLTYDVPAPKINAFTNAILRGWSTENVLQARSAPPVSVSFPYFAFFAGFAGGALGNVRPDVVPGIPLYLTGPKYPGGEIVNNTFPSSAGPGCVGPFCPPPTDSSGHPLRQGDLPRNALRGFGATQWDFAVHRDFPIHESLKLQFRAEMFNVLNHPNFGQPVGNLGFPNSPNPQFGQSIQMLGQSLSGGQVGAGAFNPLYQIGGPRSVQFALKLFF